MIDRKLLVQRHSPVRTQSNLESPMQVGNGDFAFGVDVTGLQTFVPFACMSSWGWKNDPLPDGCNPKDYKGKLVDTHGKLVRYDMPTDEQPELSQWLISNPNRLNLGRLGLRFEDNVEETDLQNTRQHLDLWTGVITSTFTLDGSTITVKTACDSNRDAVAVEISSHDPLRVSLFVDFPYCDGSAKFSAPYVGHWDATDKHTSKLEHLSSTQSRFVHELDGTSYLMDCELDGNGKFEHVENHRYALKLEQTNRFSFSAHFHGISHSQAVAPPACVPPESIFNNSKDYWPSFWKSGGAIDLSETSDPRATELERRLVLAQYIMRVNAAGAQPPQESGLVNNGWYGKFHLEMNWWHMAHLALFDRWELLNKSLGIYKQFLDSSKARAASQGYKGARWPKMTDPSGTNTPGDINALLIWQQPHAIAFAELDWRAHPTKDTLEKWKDVVFATADFMASFAFWDQDSGTFALGPPLQTVSENTDRFVTFNTSVELHYWQFGLSKALEWQKRLGLSPDPTWTRVLDNLAPKPIEDGVYVIYQGIQNMWHDYNWEHPALVGMYGWLPGQGLDLDVMRATSAKVWQTWKYHDCWGWDFGMSAANAAKLGEPSRAVDFLLAEPMPFDDVGLAPGGPRVPFPYIPATGSFLYAIGLMAGGWDGAEPGSGFPEDWVVKIEGMKKAW